MIPFKITFLVGLCALMPLTNSFAQQKPSVLIFGTGHFANNNLDVNNVKFDDMLAPKRQREIEELTNLLRKFKPTKIAVEIVSGSPADSLLQTHYQQYVKGTYQLAVREQEQIGFRLAKQLGLSKVYAIDVKGPYDIQRVMNFLKENNQMQLMQQLGSMGKGMVQRINTLLPERTVLELSRMVNAPAFIAETHLPYNLMQRIGQGNNYVGAEVVGDWYTRNAKIFANLARITESPQDRILVIYGAGHVKYLQDLVRDSQAYTLVQTNDYL